MQISTYQFYCNHMAFPLESCTPGQESTKEYMKVFIRCILRRVQGGIKMTHVSTIVHNAINTVYTCWYCSVLVCTSICTDRIARPGTRWTAAELVHSIPVHTRKYQYIPVHTSTCWNILVHALLNLFIGSSKPYHGGLTGEETALKKDAALNEQVKRAVETLKECG